MCARRLLGWEVHNLQGDGTHVAVAMSYKGHNFKITSIFREPSKLGAIAAASCLPTLDSDHQARPGVASQHCIVELSSVDYLSGSQALGQASASVLPKLPLAR